ncbi:hypothetical protein [Thalassospira alkalitolerans]|uniref:hypothetical protein n=1 Tax=Thalassospira alkalitolerans TaxID=1293890 RepID=UPI0030ECB3F8|tara:strand:+ start:41783 stop:42955 length:1173 start_codon:yes stop_codon:yes gene_type:complete
MDSFLPKLSALYPLWLLAANFVSRLGGMIILLVIGHHFKPDQLADYFTTLATIGLVVTATQAGCGPLLIRLYQGHQFRTSTQIILLRLMIAGVGITTALTLTDIGFSPVLLMPIAAALAPDWIISGRGQLGKIALIAVFGQLAGIASALIAMITGNSFALFAIAPTISLASLLAAGILAFHPTASPPNNRLPLAKPEPIAINRYRAVNLIGFTLLAGALPNLDFVLLGEKLGQNEQANLILAQRVFLIAAAMIASLSAALFAKRQSGLLRDIWLMAPALAITAILFLSPDTIAHLIFDAPPAGLPDLLRVGAPWPFLLAILARQILISQEIDNRLFPGWICLVVLILSGVMLPVFGTAENTLIVMQMRFGFCLIVLAACHFVPQWRGQSA